MTVVALHPEDLLERDARGELSAVERERLDRHLAKCAVCRFERTLRADFRQSEEPLTPDFDVHSLLSRALAPGSLAPGSFRPSRDVDRPMRLPVMRRMRPLLLIAASLFVAGASVAAGWTGIPRMQSGSQDVIWRLFQRAPRVSTGSGVASAPRTAPLAMAPSILFPSTEFVPGVALAPPVTPAPASGAPPFAAQRMPRSASRAGGVAPASNAASLFAHANAVRRSGDHSEAVELYRTLVERYPRSAEAHEAEAALGRLLLEDGNAKAALRCFDEYLYASGPLEEDVRADRAQALGRLHRSNDEAEAWSALLRAHPASVHADRARTRLRELEAAP